MSNIKLSICIPTYNFGEFIGETLSAVIAQSQDRDDVEIVVVDGASTDNTAEIVRRFQDRFPSLVYHRLERKGGIDNDLSRTVELARGRYCWFLSSDDVPSAGAISGMLREIESGCDVYLCSRTVCDRYLRPLFDQQWLSNNADHTIYTFAGPRDFISYFSRSISIGALFSYISSLVVKRDAWNAIVQDDRFTGSNYAHAARLFSILLRGGVLRYIQEPLVLCRGENDSFAANGVVRRFLIDIDGYLLLANMLFFDMNVRSAFLAVMRREHPWYVFTELRSRIGSREQWRTFRTKLLEFGYKPWKIAVVEVLGSSPPVMFAARALWFGLKRLSAFTARIIYLGRNNPCVAGETRTSIDSGGN
jgi:abequosyltransferase